MANASHGRVECRFIKINLKFENLLMTAPPPLRSWIRLLRVRLRMVARADIDLLGRSREWRLNLPATRGSPARMSHRRLVVETLNRCSASASISTKLYPHPQRRWPDRSSRRSEHGPDTRLTAGAGVGR